MKIIIYYVHKIKCIQNEVNDGVSILLILSSNIKKCYAAV